MTRWMEQEIESIPNLLRQRAGEWQDACDNARSHLEQRPVRAVLGRGSSGNACTFHTYLYALQSGRHPIEFRPWVTTQNTAPASWTDTAAVVFSVSGETTDVARAATWLSERGATVVSVTNAAPPDVDLRRLSAAHIDLAVGPERAVPATKTFLAQLSVAAGLCGFSLPTVLGEAADCISALLDDRFDTAKLIQAMRHARQVFWVARGPAFAVALDAALKLQEAAGKPGQAYSAAELHHGPIGSLTDQDFVLLLNDAHELTDSLAATATVLLGRGIPFIVIGGSDAAATAPVLPMPMPATRWARSLVLGAMVQRLALDAARSGGRNPDAPPGLAKVTHTL